ncbi:hypothetical protein [Vulgatibacter incomptus]|uniref:Putative membrane protein n=1 Tax=Vulgatibacter incomptus TaxID=1391653 RepID=A0A0K1P8G9_9BACT|nr:hypothetical protein [Vulgatibacter incomptus]AKU89797.1 putative membrane protein [Vulgatibacter incomptus]
MLDVPIRPAVRRWARSTVRALLPLVRPLPPQGNRLLLIFVDGVGGSVLRRATNDRLIRFLPSLRDGLGYRESRCFSGMPSTTTAFQAGLFFGQRYPDVPSFSWLDRASGRAVKMNVPADAAIIESRLRESAGPGLLAGGTSYASILAGGSDSPLTTAGIGRFLTSQGGEPSAKNARNGLERMFAGLPAAHIARRLHAAQAALREPGDLHAQGTIHVQTLARLLFRLGLETPGFFATTAAFCPWMGSTRHELRFLFNHLGVGTLVAEASKSLALLDLMRGVPRTFVCLHEFDEFSHRRGPDFAMQTLRRIDESVEALFALAQEVPEPPDVFVITDHGHIPAVPFEKLFGHSLQGWLEGQADGDSIPELSPELTRSLGAPKSIGRSPDSPPTVIDSGNYAHVYLGGGEPWDAARIAEHRPEILARALTCPGIGLVAMRAEGKAIALAGSRLVDPADPATVPRGASPRAVASLLEDLASSPSSGDLLLYGTWFDDACVAFSWELSSHGGPSPEETETFVLHPAGLDLSRVCHGADLYAALHTLYGAQESNEPK